MSSSSQRWFFFGCFVFVFVLSGCGQREMPHSSLYPARGRVLYKGQPASFVLVHLSPEGASGAEANGITGQDGTFELRTYSNDSFDGAVPGEYKVTLEGYDPVRAVGMQKPPAGATPTKLTGEVDAGTVEVKAEDNDLDINVP